MKFAKLFHLVLKGVALGTSFAALTLTVLTRNETNAVIPLLTVCAVCLSLLHFLDDRTQNDD